ncbi:hypothetical protein Droror1_Dr00017307 [Drosera rotundifolia]
MESPIQQPQGLTQILPVVPPNRNTQPNNNSHQRFTTQTITQQAPRSHFDNPCPAAPSSQNDEAKPIETPTSRNTSTQYEFESRPHALPTNPRATGSGQPNP